MRALVTGAAGQLGVDLVTHLRRCGAEVAALDRTGLDITDVEAVDRTVRAAGPDVVFSVGAWTDVDGAESAEEAAFRVNAEGPGHLAEAAKRCGAAIVHVSTDYVFDGTGSSPYAEDATPAPASAYGRTKAAGELAVLESGADAYVVRTAWVYGAHGNNFVRTMLRLAEQRPLLSVVDDQRGSPTWTADLARGLTELADRRPDSGIYHCTNAGETTWCGFARAIFEEAGLDPGRVRPTTTAEFPRPAPRPAYSVLGDRRWRAAGLTPLPPWRDALRTALQSHLPDFRGF